MVGTDFSCDAYHFCRWYIQDATNKQQEIRSKPLSWIDMLIVDKSFPVRISERLWDKALVAHVGGMRLSRSLLKESHSGRKWLQWSGNWCHVTPGSSSLAALQIRHTCLLLSVLGSVCLWKYTVQAYSVYLRDDCYLLLNSIMTVCSYTLRLGAEEGVKLSNGPKSSPDPTPWFGNCASRLLSEFPSTSRSFSKLFLQERIVTVALSNPRRAEQTSECQELNSPIIRVLMHLYE